MALHGEYLDKDKRAFEEFLETEETKSDPQEHFTLLEKLGEGSYGSVYKGIHKESKAEIAVKMIPVQGEWEDLKKKFKYFESAKAISSYSITVATWQTTATICGSSWNTAVQAQLLT